MKSAQRHRILVALLASLLGVPVACGGGSTRSSTSGGERSPTDAGVSADAAATDATVRDGGTPDASSSMSVGDVSVATRSDGGAVDAGPRADAGSANPWGASRDEECAAPIRPTMNPTAAQAFAEGVALVSRGDLNGAAQRFDRALQQDRRAYRAAYNLGVVADRQGRASEALDFYRQSLRIVPGYEEAIEAIVMLQVRAGSLQDALGFVAPLAVQYPWNDGIQATHSRVLALMSRWDEAFREARRGLACNERSVPALTALARAASGQGNIELASWILERVAQVETTEQASEAFSESHFLRGQIARDRPGELERAVQELNTAVQLRPDYVDARMALAQLLLLSGSYLEAARHLQVAAQAAPWSWQVRLAYADALRSLQRWDDARTELDRVALLAPDQPEIHYSRGLLFLEQASCLRTGEVSAITTCQRALGEFNAYRAGMGSRLPAGDRSYEYSQGLMRILQRLNAAVQAQQQEPGAGDSSSTASPNEAP